MTAELPEDPTYEQATAMASEQLDGHGEAEGARIVAPPGMAHG